MRLSEDVTIEPQSSVFCMAKRVKGKFAGTGVFMINQIDTGFLVVNLA